ncbi:hypothetical protein C8J57DRAFT_506651 [Mycena rebaudengoi]|nr:hypothetical protein C8J57DRAFT_506651 [Mycena rebaudengoi]
MEGPKPNPNTPTQQEKDFALRLHVLTLRRRDTTTEPEYLAERKTIREAETLAPFFTSRKNRQKYIQVAKAIVTACTTNREHTFSVMLGNYIIIAPTGSETHLFFCQHGGPPADDVQEHIHQVWSVLREIRAATLEHVDTSTDSPELTMTADKTIHLRKLADVVYPFVINQALYRAQKKLPSIAALRETLDPPLLDGFEGKLTHLLLTLAKSAMDSDESLFRSCTGQLWDMTTSPEYTANEGARQALQARAQALETHPFSISKWINKLIKVEAAVAILYALALSPSRGRIVEWPLIVHNIPLPSNLEPVEVALCDIKDDWCPPGQSLDATIDQIRAATAPPSESIPTHIPTQPKVHSECALVAWLAQNREKVAPHIILIPYVACSKHCLGCYLWLDTFNRVGPPMLPSVSYEGYHGGLRLGWWPPAMESKRYVPILRQLIYQLERHFRHIYVQVEEDLEAEDAADFSRWVAKYSRQTLSTFDAWSTIPFCAI